MTLSKGFFFSFLLIILNISIGASQNTFDIVFPQTEADRNQKCQNCFRVFANKPKEVHFSIKREKNNLFFEVNDKQWFNSLLKNSGDGIAVDVVGKERYNCNIEDVEKSQIKGLLLKPVYVQKLKAGLRTKDKNIFRVLVGKIPDAFLNKDLEFNILFLSNKNLCNYYMIYDLESYPWDLLDMGMYLDSLTYKNKKIKPNNEDAFVIKTKELKFIIPFKKNKSEYKPEDIKPLYDSLRLTDFNIKKINIRAYSSVEGNLERNIELQEQRANSIANALQTFQKPTITTEISSSENWVEFFNDISGTKHEQLKSLSKEQIKGKLVGAFSNEMEIYLKNHRKAVITLDLEKKDKYKNKTENELVTLFNSTIAQGNEEEARIIQNSIFEKMKEKKISPDFLKKMEIPNQVKFIRIFNKNAAFRYLEDIRQSMIVYNELERLEKLAPKNKEVKYNKTAIKLILWRHKALIVNENKLKSEIYALKNYKIDQILITRMMVNFHIIKAENYMRKRDYSKKDLSVDFINKNYNKFPLSDYDYLSLSQFFSYYANTKLSEKLLENKVKTIDIDEDLLFYYLNLTLVNKELTQTDDYRTILLNAVNMNKDRFCRLFNSVADGGVTFQLLEDEYLRTNYCELCN